MDGASLITQGLLSPYDNSPRIHAKNTLPVNKTFTIHIKGYLTKNFSTDRFEQPTLFVNSNWDMYDSKNDKDGFEIRFLEYGAGGNTQSTLWYNWSYGRNSTTIVDAKVPSLLIEDKVYFDFLFASDYTTRQVTVMDKRTMKMYKGLLSQTQTKPSDTMKLFNYFNGVLEKFTIYDGIYLPSSLLSDGINVYSINANNNIESVGKLDEITTATFNSYAVDMGAIQQALSKWEKDKFKILTLQKG